jgi:hypothetical protein
MLLAHAVIRMERGEDPDDIDPELRERIDVYLQKMYEDLLSKTKMSIQARLMAEGIDDPRMVEDFVGRALRARGRARGEDV